MMKRISIAIAFALLFPAPASSQPLCFMINSAGKTQDLSHICGVKPVKTVTKTEDLSLVGEVLGRPVWLDKSASTKTEMRLFTLTDNGSIRWRYNYSCAARAAAFSSAKLALNFGEEIDFEADTEVRAAVDEAASKAISEMCR